MMIHAFERAKIIAKLLEIANIKAGKSVIKEINGNQLIMRCATDFMGNVVQEEVEVQKKSYKEFKAAEIKIRAKMQQSLFMELLKEQEIIFGDKIL